MRLVVAMCLALVTAELAEARPVVSAAKRRRLKRMRISPFDAGLMRRVYDATHPLPPAYVR